jgi:hypothetical protein
MVHSCGEQDCGVLTMGEFCVEHEQRETPVIRRRLHQLGKVTAVIAVTAMGAVIRTRMLR